MATKTKAAAAEPSEDTAAAGGGKKKKIVIAVLVLVVLAALYFLVGPGKGGEPAVEAAPEPGAVLPLEPITMNLADGRLLKVGLALQLPLDTGGGHGEVDGSMALDEAIAFLGEHSYEQLAAPEGRQTAKQELSHRVAERYHDHVMEVYFTEFVMQ